MADVDCIVDKSLRLSFLETFFIQNGGEGVKKEIDIMIYDGEDIRNDPIDKGIRKELLETLVKINNEEEKEMTDIKKELDELIYDGTVLKSQYNYDEDYKAVFPCKTLGLK